jgi:hypothetical protein
LLAVQELTNDLTTLLVNPLLSPEQRLALEGVVPVQVGVEQFDVEILTVTV